MSRRRKGHPEARGQNMLWGRYVRSARERELTVNITKSQFLELTKQECYYCGQEPSQVIGNLVPDDLSYHGTYTYNGVDRRDNTRGYEPDNVVPACKWCNQAKNAMDEDVFLDWIRRVHAHKCRD